MDSSRARSGAPSHLLRLAAASFSAIVVAGGFAAPAVAVMPSASGPVAAAQTQYVSPLSIVGDPNNDFSLNAVGSWYGQTPYRFQWFLDDVPIAGATGAWYQRNFPADIGHVLTVRGWVALTGTEYAATSDPVTLGSSITAPPIFLAGEVDLGDELWPEFRTAGHAEASGGMPLQFAYAWTRDGVPVPGGSVARHTVTAEDKGHRLEVSVTLSAPGTSKTLTAGLAVPNTRSATGFTADGTPDLFARNGAGDLLLYSRNGQGWWDPARRIGTGWGGFDILLAPGDFDGDGPTDVIARDPAGRLFLYRGDGQGGWRGAQQIGQGWQVFTNLVAPGDFDGDGANDLLARDTAGQIWLYPGDGQGGWKQPRTIGWGWQGLHGPTSPGDFDGDHVPDVVAIDSAGQLMLYAGRGDGSFGGRVGVYMGNGWGALPRVGGIGDTNRDGDEDLYAVDPSGGLTLYYGNGTSVNLWDTWPYIKGQVPAGSGWGGFTAVF